jgi:hypothetical protein
MVKLIISDFSCLDDAVFEMAPVNVIIGPQGSGKSVTTKLFYFFSDILNSFTVSAERGDTIEDYKRIVSKQFCLWFPSSAWGQGRSNINYYAGEFSIRMLRRTKQGRLSDEMAVTFSDWFVETYERARELFSRNRPDDFIELESSAQVNAAIDRSYKVRDVLSYQLSRELGANYLSQQTFIPAGRAFFTSIGRLVAGFEQAGSLDPVTIKFARLFANVRDRNSRSVVSRVNRLSPEYRERRSAYMSKFFGGEIRYEGEVEFIHTEDGRQVPFTSLSSGQQELLPMWSLMDYFSELDAFRSNLKGRSPSRRELLYIEEPEAHLFPSAQSLLMEYLIGSVASERSRRNLIITTHSPYIMAKLNVFLKAGQLSRRRKRNQDINEVVPRECWLTENQLSVSAIEGKRLRNLIDEDGLIDGTYLDGVSEDISREFSALLQIESEM